ncbi:nuclease-related domain-containing protein [Paraburkholderia madseniana]|uniref:nuclease-related domain-containing protein n=1 Tax=Paraburkholderia TaxID=1822464 RepID=UPI001559CF35|nr:nuclease-related domain-containing protein [Paraburkholderia madseniana]NPT66375.1 NERD domain-containing protein [Paraburkholderia madseniana]
MKQNEVLFSHAGTDAPRSIACPQELASDLTGPIGGRDGWIGRQRRLSLPLAKNVAAVLQAMSGRVVVVRCGVVIEHAPGTRNPMTWIDCLAVAEFGAFVIDRYDWTGTVRRSTNEDELLLHEKPGVVSVQTSPLRRAKPALRHLRGLLAEYGCPVECIAVFAASHCALDPTLPETILQASELRHFMRTRLNRFRDSHYPYLDSERIGKYLQLQCADWGKSCK